MTMTQQAARPSDNSEAIDPLEFRRALGSFASGVTIITTAGEHGPIGFTCQSFYSVSIDPPLVSFSIAKTSRSLAGIRASGTVAVNFLSATQREHSAQFARSGSDKWTGIAWRPAPVTEAPLLDGAAGWVTGRLHEEIDAGDHVIFLVSVAAISADHEREPLLFFRGGYGVFDANVR